MGAASACATKAERGNACGARGKVSIVPDMTMCRPHPDGSSPRERRLSSARQRRDWAPGSFRPAFWRAPSVEVLL